MDKLGERIKFYRNKLGLTQEELAKRLKISYPTLNKYEKGHRTPDANLICSLVRIFKCDPGYLLTGVVNEVDSDFKNDLDDKIVEIVKLLKEFPEDKEIILKLLNARKAIRETYNDLGIKTVSFDE